MTDRTPCPVRAAPSRRSPLRQCRITEPDPGRSPFIPAAFTFATGNADGHGHGKNISLPIDTETGSVVPAPLYDTVPTALWPNLRPTSAMSVNGTFEPTSLHDFVAEAHRWGVGAATAERVLAALVADLRQAISTCTHDAIATLVGARLDLLESN